MDQSAVYPNQLILFSLLLFHLLQFVSLERPNQCHQATFDNLLVIVSDKFTCSMLTQANLCHCQFFDMQCTNFLFIAYGCGIAKNAVWNWLAGICCCNILRKLMVILGAVTAIHVHTQIAHVHLIRGVNF